MGDVVRRVKLYGLKDDGVRVIRVGSAVVWALLDTGATVSVINEETAKTLGGHITVGGDTLEGKDYRTMHVSLNVEAIDCKYTKRHVVVSDELTARIGNSKATMILGSDYMQRNRLTIGLSLEADDEFVGCRVDEPLKPKKPRKKVTTSLATARPAKKNSR